MKRYKHNLSSQRIFSMADMGYLYPCNLMEILPGDSVQGVTNALIRLSPLVAPMMHKVDVRIHHFFVPHRLVWTDWENFITKGSDGNQTPLMPTQTTPVGSMEGSIFDAYGIAPASAGVSVQTLPLRGYNLIYNEYFRDQDLQTSLTVAKGSGADSTVYQIQRICWEKDYFTVARPWAQKGTAVSIPLEGEVPVIGIGKVNANFPGVGGSFRESTGSTRSYATSSTIDGTTGDNAYGVEQGSTGFPNIRVDLEGYGIDVIEARAAFALFRFQEARAKWGSKYVDYLRYLGIKPSDARLQRPEYLGGGRNTLQVSEVLETAQTVDSNDDPLGITGGLKGHGIGGLRTNKFRRFFEEHGYIHSFISIRPKAVYCSGVERHWLKRTFEDFFQKELQFVGMQEIDRKEVWASSASATPFGFIDRYAEYMRAQSTISGEFRSTLNYWHMGRIFSSEPSLNSDFVTCDPTDRVFAVPSEDLVYVMAKNKFTARRMVVPMGRESIVL